MEISFHFVREMIPQGHLQFRHISTKDQIAATLTKSLIVDKFNYFQDKLQLRPQIVQSEGDIGVILISEICIN